MAALKSRGVPNAAIGTVTGNELRIKAGNTELALSVDLIRRSLNTLNDRMMA
jgi:hypothetical protein